MRLTPNVLYVEDDPDTRELMSVILKMENYQVVLAESYNEALLLALVMRFDLYMMDNWMPGGSGIELCKTLRVFDATTPIIFTREQLTMPTNVRRLPRARRHI